MSMSACGGVERRMMFRNVKSRVRVLGAIALAGILLSACGSAPKVSPYHWSTPLSIDQAALTSIDCVSSTFCVATDNEGGLLIFNGASWSAPHLFNVKWVGTSCANNSLCVAAGTTVAGGVAAEYNGTTWSTPSLINPGKKVTSIGCAQSQVNPTCYVGAYTRVFKYESGAWTHSGPFDSDDVGTHGIASIACESASQCVAVDGKGNALMLQNGDWSVSPGVGPAQSANTFGLTSVSCISPSQCLAVDAHGDLIDVESKESVSGAPGVADVDLTGISCTSSGWCTYVDKFGDAFRTEDGVKLSKFKMFTEIDPGFVLTSISCPTTAFCAAVDNGGNVLYLNVRQ